MDNISQIIDMLELEIEKDKSDKNELDQMKTLNDLYEEIVKSATDIDEIIENKETILIILDMVNKDIALQLSKKLVVVEHYKQKQLTYLSEYQNVVNYVSKLFNKINRKNEEIKDKINELTKKIEGNSEKVTLFKIALTQIKFKQYIPYKIVTFLEKFFEEKEIPKVEQIRLLEFISIYNRNVYERIHNYPQSYKNEVLDMLSFGYEIIEDDSLDYNKDVERKVDLHYSLLKYQNDFNEYFEEIKQELPNENDLKLFYMLMIKKIQSQILETISLIKTKEFYVDLEAKNEIIQEYNQLTDLYLKFRNEYFNTIKHDEETSINSAVKIIFAKDAKGKNYFLRDLKYVNKEYLSKVLELIESLKDGTLTNKVIEGFTSRYKEFRKLKYDQVRIVIIQSIQRYIV